MITIEEVAKQYGVDESLVWKLRSYAEKQNKIPVKKKLSGAIQVDESNAAALVNEWKTFYEEEQFLKDEEERIRQVAREMPITSGAGFEGYRITHYGGYVSGDEAILLSDSWFGSGFSKDAINNAIKGIRITAIEELKMAASQIGCNAVIGLDFDYVTVDRQRTGLTNTVVNETYIILTANGTAVTIEKA